MRMNFLTVHIRAWGGNIKQWTSGPPKPQIRRRAALADCLCLVARLWPVGRPLAPIVRLFSEPFKAAMPVNLTQCPANIIVDIAGNPELSARFQDPVQLCQVLLVDEAALVMARLWPRIGKQQEGTGKTGIRKLEQAGPDVVIENPDIAKMLLLDLGKQLGNAVDEGFGADNANARIVRSLPCQVFTAAEPDFQPDLIDRLGENACGVCKCRCIVRDPQAGQEFGHQPGVVAAQ